MGQERGRMEKSLRPREGQGRAGLAEAAHGKREKGGGGEEKVGGLVAWAHGRVDRSPRGSAPRPQQRARGGWCVWGCRGSGVGWRGAGRAWLASVSVSVCVRWSARPAGLGGRWCCGLLFWVFSRGGCGRGRPRAAAVSQQPRAAAAAPVSRGYIRAAGTSQAPGRPCRQRTAEPARRRGSPGPRATRCSRRRRRWRTRRSRPAATCSAAPGACARAAGQSPGRRSCAPSRATGWTQRGAGRPAWGAGREGAGQGGQVGTCGSSCSRAGQQPQKGATTQERRAAQCKPQSAHLAGHHGGGQGVQQRGVARRGVRHAERVPEVGIHNVGGQARAARVCGRRGKSGGRRGGG